MKLSSTILTAAAALSLSAVTVAFAHDLATPHDHAAPAIQPAAGDVSGTYTWEGGGGGGGGGQTTTLTLKQEGDKLTGTISGRGGDTPIENGTVDGSTIKFTVTREWNGNKMTTEYTGTVSGSDLKLTQTTKREIEAKKSA